MTEDESKITHARRATPPANDWPSFARHLLRTPSGISIDFDPGKWTPIQDAFARIREVVGDFTAERDMQTDAFRAADSGETLDLSPRWRGLVRSARWRDAVRATEAVVLGGGPSRIHPPLAQ